MAAPVFRAAAESSSTSVTTSHIVTVPTVVDNDVLIACICMTRNATPPHDINTPAGWTQMFHEDIPGASAVVFAVYRKVASSEPASYDFTSTDDMAFAAIMVSYSGANGTPDVVSTYNNGASTAPQSPSVTTTVADTRVIRIAMNDDDDMADPGGEPASHTVRGILQIATPGNGCAVGLADTTQASAGPTGTADWTLDFEEDWGAITFALASSVAAEVPAARPAWNYRIHA